MSTVKGVALVTGSAQGLGRSIALRLASDGFDVVLNDIAEKSDELRAVADDIEKIGRKTHVVPGDVTVEEQVKGMVQDAVNELDGLDVMVANAGVGPPAFLMDTELDMWDEVMAVNARGPFLCYKYAAQQMIKQGRGGRIIGASSVLGKTGMQGAAAYAASKFAVRGLTQAAALELGRYNITVNSYAPGAILTPMTALLFGGGRGNPDDDQDVLQALRNVMYSKPIKYEGQPEDIASIVSYLASKEAHFITGQCISVDGGIVLS